MSADWDAAVLQGIDPGDAVLVAGRVTFNKNGTHAVRIHKIGNAR